MTTRASPHRLWGSFRHGLRNGCSALSLLLILITAAPVFSADGQGGAQPFHIAIVGSGNSTLDARIERALQAELGLSAAISVVPAPDPDADLHLALGPLALLRSLTNITDGPVVALLVTSDTFEEMAAAKAGQRQGMLSGIFYDAPLKRHAILGHLLVPTARRIALLDTVENSVVDAGEIDDVASLGLPPEIFYLEDPSALISVLNRALDYGDLLLGTANQTVYNRNTIKHLLLTAYRRNRFLIGPTQAYVQAGALGSTYTTIEQFVQQAAKLIIRYRDQGRLPDAHHSSEFNIALNAQVARSLNLSLPDAAQLKAQIIAQERPAANPARESSP